MSIFKKRGSRARRRVAASIVLMLSIAGVATIAQTPAQAGDADESRNLNAAMYDQTGYGLNYVESWTQYGYSGKAPTDVPANGASPYGLHGSPIDYAGACLNTACYSRWVSPQLSCRRCIPRARRVHHLDSATGVLEVDQRSSPQHADQTRIELHAQQAPTLGYDHRELRRPGAWAASDRIHR
jgi:hypothetical protein